MGRRWQLPIGQTSHTLAWCATRDTRHECCFASLIALLPAYLDKWRQELKQGVRVDAQDSVGKVCVLCDANAWLTRMLFLQFYTSTVVRVDGEMVVVNFDGWSDAYNEQIARSSDRLALYRTMVGGNSSARTADRVIDDKEDAEGCFALWRVIAGLRMLGSGIALRRAKSLEAGLFLR